MKFDIHNTEGSVKDRVVNHSKLTDLLSKITYPVCYIHFNIVHIKLFYRLYHKLPEVQERQKILQRQELYAKNRERAKSYHQVTSYCGTCTCIYMYIYTRVAPIHLYFIIKISYIQIRSDITISVK